MNGEMHQQHWFEPLKPFVFGGVSGMIGTCIIQPVDTVKVRIQIMGESGVKESPNPFAVAAQVIKKEGLAAIYKGLDSALFRQATYATARIGIYRSMYNWRMENEGKVPFHEKAAMSLVSGFLGALVGNPSDLALVRFQADSTLPKEERRNYKHVFDAFRRIVAEEGFLKLWRGSAPTIARAMCMNLGQLSSFDSFKETVMKFRDGKWDMASRVITSTMSGIVAVFVSLPADNLKTKLQKMKRLPDGTFPYYGFFDCLVQSVEREGVLGLWIGWQTFIFRVVPHTVIVLILVDYLNSSYGGVAQRKN